MNNDQNPNEYGMPEENDPRWVNGLRNFSEADPRTFSEVVKDRPKMNIWERFACCCGCILIIPVPLAILGLLFA